jgi:hypothetical protein
MTGEDYRRAAPSRGRNAAPVEPHPPCRGRVGELLIEFSTPTAGASWTDTGVRREQRQLQHRQGRDALGSEPARADNASDGSSRHVRHDGRWPALPRSSPGPTRREHVRPDLAKGTNEGTDGGRGRQSTRRTSVRPQARRRVHLAQRRRALHIGRGVGRAQRGSAAPDLRQVHRRPGGGSQEADHRRARPDRSGRLDVLTGDVGQSREGRLIGAGGVRPMVVVVMEPGSEPLPT